MEMHFKRYELALQTKRRLNAMKPDHLAFVEMVEARRAKYIQKREEVGCMGSATMVGDEAAFFYD